MLTIQSLEVFLLILGRMVGFFFRVPFFNIRFIPAAVRIGLSFWTSLCLWFIIPLPKFLPANLIGFLIAMSSEVLLGILIGLIADIILTAVQAAGELMDIQMGLSVAMLLDPTFGANISIIGRLAFMTAILLFLVLDGHHLLIQSLIKSFQLIPLGLSYHWNIKIHYQLMELGTFLWITAIQISAPILILIFLSDFTFGMLSRVAPQVNVFMLGFQVKPMVGVFMFLSSLPFIVVKINQLINKMGTEILLMLSNLMK
jgi:flagellar biosynthetic protein FliR